MRLARTAWRAATRPAARLADFRCPLAARRLQLEKYLRALRDNDVATVAELRLLSDGDLKDLQVSALAACRQSV